MASITPQVDYKGKARLRRSQSTSADGPVSRILSRCLRTLDGHSSRRSIAAPLKQPTRKFQHFVRWRRLPKETPRSCRRTRFGAPGRYAMAAWVWPLSPCLFGLAPCGVYPAIRLTPDAVRSYRTFSPLPAPLAQPLLAKTLTAPAVFSLWHWPYSNLDAGTPDVIRHTALRSPDFPPPARRFRLPGSDRPARLLR